MHDHRGQTLVELIAALFVITTGLLGVLGLTTSNVKNESIGLMRLVAFHLSREGIEIARNIRDTNWLADRAWDTGLGSDGAHCGVSTLKTKDTFTISFSFQPAIDCATDPFDPVYQIYLDNNLYYQRQDPGDVALPQTPTPYVRRLRFDQVCLNKTQAQLDSGDIDNTTETVMTDGGCVGQQVKAAVQVTSEVFWRRGSETAVMKTSERLYNWR